MLVLALPDNLMFCCVVGITAAFLKGLEDPKVLGRDDTVAVKPFTSLTTQDYFHFFYTCKAPAVKNNVLVIFCSGTSCKKHCHDYFWTSRLFFKFPTDLVSNF